MALTPWKDSLSGLPFRSWLDLLVKLLNGETTTVTTSYDSNAGSIVLTRIGSDLVCAQIRQASGGTTGSESIGTITAGWRPSAAINFNMMGGGLTELDSINLNNPGEVNTNGIVQLNIASSEDDTYSCSITWRI